MERLLRNLQFPELRDLVERSHEEEELDHGPRQEHRRHRVLPVDDDDDDDDVGNL